MKKREFIVMDYQEFNELIKKHYNIKYDFISNQESSNDCMYEFKIKKEQMQDYDLIQLENFKNKKDSYYLASTLMIDLCNKDILEESDYLIDVNW